MIYGSLGKMSGGYLYDRIVVEGLRAAGHRVEIISMPDVGWWKALGHNWDSNLLEESLDLGLDLLVQDELNHPSLFLFNHFFKRQAKKPIVSVVHHLRSSELHSPLAAAIYATVERHYLNSVDAFVFNSRFTMQDVNRLSPLKQRPWVLAYPGKDRLGVRLDEETIRRRCRRPGPLKLLFVGNVIPRKGLIHVLEALQDLPYESWELTVVGSQSAHTGYSRRIQQFIKKFLPEAPVKFLGLQPDLVVRQIYQESQVLVLPSDIEGFGIVYAEALGFGLPCIASALGGGAEIVTDNRHGWLISHGDSQRLRQLLRQLIQDRTLLEQLSLGAISRYDELSSWSETQQSIKAFLEQLSL